MLHDILDDDHIQWQPPLIGHCTNFWPLLIWTLLPNLTFYLIVQGFHRTYATGAACQQRTLTPPDTWSCPTLGLACVLMSRPISPELVLSPELSLGTSLLLPSLCYLGALKFWGPYYQLGWNLYWQWCYVNLLRIVQIFIHFCCIYLSIFFPFNKPFKLPTTLLSYSVLLYSSVYPSNIGAPLLIWC